MDNNPMDKQLYDFLNSYNLIQSDFNEEEARERIVAAMESLYDDENILTGFIAKVSHNKGPESDRAFLITDKDRIVLSADESGAETIINVKDIESIKSGEGFAQDQLSLNTVDGSSVIYAQSDDGAESLSDALYTALSEVLPKEKIQTIFDFDSEEFAEVDEPPIGEEPVEEVIEEVPYEEEPPVIIEEEPPIEEVEITPEEPQEYEEFIEEPITGLEDDIIETEPAPSQTQDTAPINNYTPSAQESTGVAAGGSAAAAAVATEPSTGTGDESGGGARKGKFTLNKPLLYVAGAVLLVILGVALWNIWTRYSENSTANRNAEELVNYLNQIDNIYYTAVDYMNAGPGATTPDQWAELDTQARSIQEELATFQANDLSDNLYQAVYFYDDALLTAIYYGQSFATTGNPLQQSTLQARLESAYQNRLEALSFIESDFPQLEDSVEHATNLQNEQFGFPQAEEAERLQQEANSHPSEGAANRENTESSNEARQSSTNSRESQE